MQSITLFYRRGSSDKVYRLSIEAAGERWVVNFAYGRRGASRRPGTKTPSPVALEIAKRIYDEVLADKLHEGYAAEVGTPPPSLMQTKEGRAVGFDFARAVQTELWGRNYGHSWGIRDEFTSLFTEHPDLLALSVKEAADRILANLPAWSPVLAAKERKAKAAYISPEQIKALDALIEKLRRSIKTKLPVGPEAARVFICDFDPESEPNIKPETWGVYSHDNFMGAFDSQEKALSRAQELVDRSVDFEVTLTSDETSVSLNISAKKTATKES